jgi:hypothetical protein
MDGFVVAGLDPAIQSFDIAKHPAIRVQLGPSLRAQRSNPALRVKLDCCAPRNDGDGYSAIAGLDPAIHRASQKALFNLMDARVKPAHGD